MTKPDFINVYPDGGLFAITNPGVYLIGFNLQPITFITNMNYNIDISLCVYDGATFPGLAGNKTTLLRQTFNYNHFDDGVGAMDFSGSSIFSIHDRMFINMMVLKFFLHIRINELSDILYFDDDDSWMQVRLLQ